MSRDVIYRLHKKENGELEELEYLCELIRCKDCRFYRYEWCHRLANVVAENDFCSYGEREGE